MRYLSISKLAMFPVISISIAACQTVPQPQPPTATQLIQQQQATDLRAVAHAEKETSPARGTKTCTVQQYTSAYRLKEKLSVMGMNYGSNMSDVHARVFGPGRVGLAISDDVYPGTSAYFLINGRRYSAPGDNYAMLDSHGLQALQQEAKIDYSWTTWPYRSEGNRADIFAGFKAAYDDCVTFLSGR